MSKRKGKKKTKWALLFVREGDDTAQKIIRFDSETAAKKFLKTWNEATEGDTPDYITCYATPSWSPKPC